MKNQKFLTAMLLAMLGTATAAYGQTTATQDQTFELSEQKLRNMRFELCAAVQMARSHNDYDFKQEFNSKLLTYSGIEATEAQLSTELAKFWNYHSPNMICGNLNGTYPRQHLFQRAIAMNIGSNVLDDYFFADEIAFPIDPNTVGFHTDGSSSTVIDYIDSILRLPHARRDYNVGYLRGLREILVDLYGAKSVEALDTEDRATRLEIAKDVFRKHGRPMRNSDSLPTRLEKPADCAAQRFNELLAYAKGRHEQMPSTFDHLDVAELEPAKISCLDHEIFGAVVRVVSPMKVSEPDSLYRKTFQFVTWHDVDDGSPVMTFVDSHRPAPMERLTN